MKHLVGPSAATSAAIVAGLVLLVALVAISGLEMTLPRG